MTSTIVTSTIVSAFLGAIVSYLVGLVLGPILKEPIAEILKGASGDLAKSMYGSKASQLSPIASLKRTTSQPALSEVHRTKRAQQLRYWAEHIFLVFPVGIIGAVLLIVIALLAIDFIAFGLVREAH